MKLLINRAAYYLVCVLLITGCSDKLNLNPLDQLSNETFWKTENDAHLALMGAYAHGSFGSRGDIGFMVFDTYLSLEAMTDNGNEKDAILTHFNNGELTAANKTVNDLWSSSYKRIGVANNFLTNIDQVDMDQAKKEEMRAEAKFLRAYFYFNLFTYWGGVPLVTQPLTISEANTLTRVSREDIVNFTINELTDAITYLPDTRPDIEYGRATKSAAKVILGRIFMAEKKWSDAVRNYKEIIDQSLFAIDDDYAALFLSGNEQSAEIILPIKYAQDTYQTAIQRAVVPFQAGGWHQYNPFNELVEDYPMIDGKSIHESPLYDPNNPYENRDPRLDMSIFIPGRSAWKGQLFDLHPDAGAAWRVTDRDWSGYGLKKFADENHTGAIQNYGGDFPMLRYAEVLISYLESKIEAGEAIDQALLDQTINKLRSRTSVNIAPVTTTDAQELREIVRRERRIELAFEGLRLYDLHRWGISHIKMNGWLHGMKLTNSPASYTALPVNENGYFRYIRKQFRENVDYKWPIPLRELEINPELEQNPGY